MPRKRTSALSGTSAAVKRMWNIRFQESYEDKALCLADNCRRNVASTATESKEAAAKLSALTCIRNAVSRAAETEETVEWCKEICQCIIAQWTATWADKKNSAFDFIILQYHSKWIKYAHVCHHCQAKNWKGESIGTCCSNEEVKLQPIEEPSELLKTLLLGHTEYLKHFLKNGWKYNNAFLLAHRSRFQKETSCQHLRFKDKCTICQDPLFYLWTKNQSFYKFTW